MIDNRRWQTENEGAENRGLGIGRRRGYSIRIFHVQKKLVSLIPKALANFCLVALR